MSHSPAAPPHDPAFEHYLAWLFAFHRVAVRQQLFALGERYDIVDESGALRFHAVRPPHLAARVAAIAAGTITALSLSLGALVLLLRDGQIIPAIALFLLGGPLGNLVTVLITPYRHLTVYDRVPPGVPVLTLRQDNKFGFFRRFTVLDATGAEVARARRNVLTGIWRRRWEATTPDGRPIAIAQEDTLLLSLLRRYLGPLWGVLRANFDLVLPEGPRVGEYNRQLTLRDHYVLDMTADPYVLADRRVCLALALLLDTAEGR
jgi:uncharacterized protein YxjI